MEKDILKGATKYSCYNVSCKYRCGKILNAKEKIKSYPTRILLTNKENGYSPTPFFLFCLR